ncbi:MAG: alpha/beta fold hydrolase [Bacteroidia bacterium]|nr:alpha/beta fold hydrolase [Bacteroidia bacterium]
MEQLLLLHGAIGAKDQLEPLKQPLKQQLSSQFIVHSINFSGHGSETLPEHFSIEQFAKDVITFLDKHAIPTISIFGYSMGGYVALYLAKHHPDRVKKVMTLATKFLWTPEIAQKEVKMLNPDVIAEKLPAFAQTLENRHQPNDWKVVLQKTAAMMLKLGEQNTLSLTDYPSIEQPVMITIGDKDNMVTLEETIAVYRQLKNAQFMVFPNTQHPIERVDVNRLSAEIRSWF